MIGLICGLRGQVQREFLIPGCWEPVNRETLEQFRKLMWLDPSRRYYELFDACPLRLPGEPT